MQRLLRLAYRKFYLRLSGVPGALLKVIKEPASVKANFSRIHSGFTIFKNMNRRIEPDD